MSIRLRLAAVFITATAVLYGVGSWLFVTTLSSSLLNAIDAQLATQLSPGTVRRYVPAACAGRPRSGSPLPGEYVLQVIDARDRVCGASPDAGSSPFLPAAELSLARHHRITITTREEDENQRVMAEPLAARPGWVAAAAVSLESYDATLSDVTRGVVIGGLVLVAAAGLGGYGLARAALSPVERMRREVAALSERDPAPSVQVPRTRDEIAALAVTMNALLSRLQQALARQRALVADASHELRTPFAVLRGELELAGQPGRTQADLGEAVGRAAEEAARLARITDQLLFLARTDEDQMIAHRAPAGLPRLLETSAQQAAVRAREAGVTCQVQAPADLTANIDAEQIREATDNLVDNALRFAPSGSVIHLSARASGHDLLIEVSDQGPGFPEDFLPRAFERFARPDSGRSRADGGAGLGLAIVSAIARAHGGRAQAANQPGGGARVTLTLPGVI
jgi:two-component system, OmpR family, sensor kinase